MFDTPRISHAAWSIVACMVCIAMGAYVPKKLETTFYIGALFFALVTVLMLWRIIVRTHDDHIEVMERFARTYGALSDEARAAMAFQFPALRYRIRRGKVREFFEDTNVPIEQFRLFLQDSNRKYIAPERNWNTAERPRAAWTEIKEWLESGEHILPDSAAGSHSWLWEGNSYDHFIAYWLAGRQIRDLNADEFQSSPVWQKTRVQGD